MRISPIAGSLFVISIAISTTANAQALKREPAMGTLREGQRVLVDDGTCGRGRIKEVIGGNHVEVGGFKQIKRIRRCLAR